MYNYDTMSIFDSTVSVEATVISGSFSTDSYVPVVLNGVSPSAKVLGRLLLISKVWISVSPEVWSVSEISGWSEVEFALVDAVRMAAKFVPRVTPPIMKWNGIDNQSSGHWQTYYFINSLAMAVKTISIDYRLKVIHLDLRKMFITFVWNDQQSFYFS